MIVTVGGFLLGTLTIGGTPWQALPAFPSPPTHYGHMITGEHNAVTTAFEGQVRVSRGGFKVKFATLWYRESWSDTERTSAAAALSFAKLVDAGMLASFPSSNCASRAISSSDGPALRMQLTKHSLQQYTSAFSSDTPVGLAGSASAS